MITPGLYRHLDNADYHGNPECKALSKGGIDKLLNSPAHFRAYMDEREIPTPEMNFGSAFHTYILEPEKYDQEVIVKRSAPPKERQEHDQHGLTLITESDFEAIQYMGDSLQKSGTAMGILNHPDAIKEESAFWKDYRFGFLCKCRPDIRIPSSPRIISDIKTTRDASPDGFARACATFNYDIQAFWYTHGLKMLTGESWDNFIFIVCEKNPPYAVALYRADREMINNGFRKASQATPVYNECLKSGVWPGYQDKIQDISIPRWAIAV